MNIRLDYEQGSPGLYRVVPEDLPEGSACDRIVAELDGQRFPVFRQGAGCYGCYSEYMRRHGCACCTLTTVLAAYEDSQRELTPELTLGKTEYKVFGRRIWEANYTKPMSAQMPVSLYGISVILSHYGISHRYVRRFVYRDSLEEIRRHLLRKGKVIVETRRIKKCGRRILSLCDRKYAGSYHTMLLLGIDPQGQVLFTDSADRSWSGSHQRLKRTDLKDLGLYMFSVRDPLDRQVYFHRRRGTGGYILLN